MGTRILLTAMTGVTLLVGGACAASAQSTLESRSVVPLDRGTVGAGLALRELDGVKRVLMIGAHPDDEDTSLLAALARGRGVRTAYLSLTRGGGGQNLIGAELGEGLGALRTGELLAARSLDGGRQFFTRAFDFGYSKSADEALSLWPRDELLRDVTWVVRTFRPHVIVSVFSGTPADGHGQHQAAGIMAHEVFDVAGDPSRYPEQLADGVEAWQPRKLYRRAWRNPGEATLSVPTGSYDPLLGRSHFQLAMESRSQHRSQDMGTTQPLGPRASSLVLVREADGVDRTSQPDDGGFFAGVDTALVELLRPLPPERRAEIEPALRGYRHALSRARGSLNALDPGEAVEPLAEGLRWLREARDVLVPDVGAGASVSLPAGGAGVAGILDRRIARVEEALSDAAGVVVDVRVQDDLVVPGQTVGVVMELWNGGRHTVEEPRPALEVPDSWSVAHFTPGTDRGGIMSGPPRARGRGGSELVGPDDRVRLLPGEAVRWAFEVDVPAGAEVSELYYLERERDGEMYRWPDDRDLWARPKNPPPIRGVVDFRLEGRDPAEGSAVSVAREGEYVGVDKASGQFREPVLVVPALSVGADPGVLVWPTRSTEARTVAVPLRSFAPDQSGTLSLEAPTGWTVEPASVSFDFAEEGEEQSFAFTVRPGPEVEPGRHDFRAVAESGEGRYDRRVDLLDYPHIERVALFHDAVTSVTVVPVRVAEGIRVGYVMGSGDDGFDAIRQLGVDVRLLAPDRVLNGDFSGFDVLVMGVRAYETRPDLQAANERVLDFARRGGTVVVQYNKYEFPRGGYAPYPVDMSRPHDRTTDETSPVRLLEPDHPVLSSPNRIGPADFEGWVTERGLYFLGEWDERYTPLLETVDPGEEPMRGSLMVARLGEGAYVYTGLSLFRQLPVGVPGAYRLLANLISLDAQDLPR